MAVAVSLINMKGGVGKTTVAAQLAHAVAADGLRVLAVDLDPQSNLSHSIMGYEQYLDHLEARLPTIVQVLQEYVPSGGSSASPRRTRSDSIILSGLEFEGDAGPDLIPSRLELSQVLKNPTGTERRLARFLALVHDRYDLIVIDCAPTESILTQTAYFASRYVVVPVKPEYLATVGLPLLERSIDDFRSMNRDHQLDIAGLVLNHQSEYADNQEKSAAIENVKSFAEERNWTVFDYQMPYSRSYAQASRDGMPLAHTRHARTDRVAGFGGLKDEILRALGLGGENR